MEMAEIAASFVGPAIEEVVKCVGAPIKRQFNYLCCFTTNINDLKHEAEELENVAGGLQGQVDRATDNVLVIVPEVETWIKRSNDIKDLKNTILDEVPNVESGCLKLGARFSLSKRAKKTTDRMKELRSQCKFDVIFHPGTSAAMEAIPLGTTFEFKSRKQIEEDIMTSLRDGDVNMIGICGMGGLGKTTMAKMIMNRALKEHVFEEVVMAVVSQPVDKLKIQLEIGGSLGLDLKDETSEASRVQKLRARLTACTKRILLVLDDVWERLVVEELGIPRGSKGCTILLTSRNSDVLSAMDVEKVFGMEVLSEEDAWLLFKGRAGTCVDDTGLNSIAKQVVQECRGLPIALSTVGAALKDKKNKRIWKDAVTQLRKANPANIPDFIKEVYNPLRVSYNKLESEEAKSVFLLCCLFGEDADIRLDDLTYFCMGLGIFEGGNRNFEEARNKMCAVSELLKRRSLLLDGRNEYYVRMHDVVRDVCIFIAKQEGYTGHNDCAWISSSLEQAGERSKLPTNLHLLFLSGDSYIEEALKLHDSSFLEGIRNLHVLFIQKNYSSLTALPHATPSLKNLKSLLLYSCWRLETISVVGELVNLEVLICRDCESIKELPPEIKGLNRLKLLDLTGCRYLKRIGVGIISSLVGLEELKMLRSFKKWDREERENGNGNARLRELEALINLRCLEIQIEDPSLAAENMRLSSKLERFQITIPSTNSSFSYEVDSYPSNKKMSVEWKGGTCVGDWIEMQLIRDTECLRLTGNGANNVDYLTKSDNIRWLEVGKCKTMKNIGRTSLMHNATVFPHMEFLKLFSLPQLEEIWDGPISSNSFHSLNKLLLRGLPALKQFWKSSSSPVFTNLSSIHISRCHSLLNLGQFSIAGNDCLPQLQTLYIYGCKMMEQVFLWNEEEDQNINNSESTITKMFPKLNKVELSFMPNLVTFCCQGIEGCIEFPLLTTMYIEECPKMTSMVSSNENNPGGSSNADIGDHYSLHLFCQPQKVSFGNLKELRTHRNPFSCGHKIHVSLFSGLEVLDIFEYEGSMSLFSPSIARDLVSLKQLSIRESDELVQVIKDDEEEKAVSAAAQRTTLLFPKLQGLHLMFLPKLVSFCEWKCDVELPSLRELHIYECPNMTSMVSSNENNSGGRSNADIGDHHSLHLFCQPQKVSFGNLKKLRTHRNPFSCGHKIHVSFFSGLEEIYISSYKGSRSLFTPSIARDLVSLKELSIGWCDELIQVIKDDEEEKAASAAAQWTTLLFPKLQQLSLSDLPKLVSFCEWKCDVELPSLSKVEIWSCPNMKYFTSLGPLNAPNLEAFDSNLNINYLQVSLDNQKVLSIEGNDNPFYRYIIPISFFNGLHQLTISCYKGSMSLFSSSTAGELVSLKKLSIIYCHEMVKVIEDKEEKEEDKLVSAAAQRTTLLFPKLQELRLENLPKLVSFCEWKCDVELPSLRELTIDDCPNMKYFTSLGPLTAPNLEYVKINWKDFGGGKDLNETLLQQHYLAQAKKKQEERRKAVQRWKQRRRRRRRRRTKFLILQHFQVETCRKGSSRRA